MRTDHRTGAKTALALFLAGAFLASGFAAGPQPAAAGALTNTVTANGRPARGAFDAPKAVLSMPLAPRGGDRELMADDLAALLLPSGTCHAAVSHAFEGEKPDCPGLRKKENIFRAAETR